MRPYILAAFAGLALAAALFLVFACSGCVCVAVYAPAARRASLYAHDQNATNMTINQDIPVTAQMAESLSGVIGAKIDGNTVGARIEGNTVKGIEKQK